MFNWHDLVFFLEVARQQRVITAARRLRVHHATVSRRISELERSLGVKLFKRKKDGFLLTEEGHKLLVIAERIELQSNTAIETISEKSNELSGKVRLNTMEGIAAYYLTQQFVRFNETHPNIIIELITERHLINLSKREADISVSFVPPIGPRLDVQRAGTFRLGLYASRKYLNKRGLPNRITDLEEHDFVDYVPDLVMIKVAHWLLDVINPEHVVFRSSSMAAQQNALAAGRGIGLLPYFSAKGDARLVRILSEVSVEREVFVSVHEDIKFMGRIRAVTKFLLDLFEKDSRFLND